jgi:YegS/Rv2252/BmrU family lipid kinase
LSSTSSKPVAVIINPISGGATPDIARKRAELARQTLASQGQQGDVLVTERRGHAHELAAAAAQRGARLVIAWGGDGTVNEVASALAFGPTPLGILPSGSGNGLASDLKIGADAGRAILEALNATPRSIDAGELGGRLFFSVAGVGFDAHIASCFDSEPVNSRGFAGYLRITLRELRRYKPADYTIEGDVSRVVRNAILVTLANSTQFGNGARIAPAARVDDGWLDLVVVEERSRFSTMCALPRLFTGGAARIPGATMARIERITIESDRPLTFHVDGEPVKGGARLSARVHPGALRISVR